MAGRKAYKRATGHYGQTLLWGGASPGMQGVTELVRCERTADAWLTEVQQQLRYGQLSNDNHAFLHGRPTSVPGSWVSLAASAATRFVQTLRPRTYRRRKFEPKNATSAGRSDARVNASPATTIRAWPQPSRMPWPFSHQTTSNTMRISCELWNGPVLEKDTCTLRSRRTRHPAPSYTKNRI